MCHFMFLSNIDGPRWMVMGLATKMALTVSGLINLSYPVNKRISLQLGLRKANHICGAAKHTDTTA